VFQKFFNIAPNYKSLINNTLKTYLMTTTTNNARQGGTKRKSKSGDELSKPDSHWKALVEFLNDSKIDKKIETMEATKQYSLEFVKTFYPLFKKPIEQLINEALVAEREKAAEKADAERKKAAEKAEAERKKFILNLYKLKTFDVKGIAHITGFSEEYIQKTIDDYKESLLKKA
jgi:DNA-directed RNA polymerase specialized sigma subunit